MTNEKINSWSTLKGALIITVVIGHFCQLYSYRSPSLLSAGIPSLFCLIYSFHMPLFCFISGYFSKSLEKRRSTAFKELLFPFLLAQLVIGVVTLLSDRNLNIFKNPLYATYGTWYLAALYIWRMCMPDLAKVKRLPVFAVILFFCTPLFWGMDNTLGIPRTLGFFCFFLAGYHCSESKVKQFLKIPKSICIAFFLIEYVAFILLFQNTNISYNQVSRIFTHGLTITSNLQQIPFLLAAYGLAFFLAIFNSLLFLTLFFRDSKNLAVVGIDTMPLYLSHLALVKVFEAFMRPMPDVVYLVLSVPVAVLMVIGFSSAKYRSFYNNTMNRIKNSLFHM